MPLTLPGFSGTYTIALHDTPGGTCVGTDYLGEGDATLVVVQKVGKISITYTDNNYTFTFTGTIDGSGNFTTTEMSTGGLVFAGSLKTMSGTFSDPQNWCGGCTYPWDTNLFGYLAYYCD